MPAVTVQCLAPFSPFVGEARISRDPAGGRVHRRVHQLDSVQVELIEGLHAQCAQGPGRHPAAAGRGHNPVGHFPDTVRQVQAAQADLAEEA